MSRAKNPTIGSCPCPIVECHESCEVRRFGHTAVRDTGSRFAGKLYLICPAHGQLGLDARKQIQDYILGHAKIPRADDVAVPAPPPAADPPKPAPAAAAPLVSAQAPAPKRKSWGTVLDD